MFNISIGEWLLIAYGVGAIGFVFYLMLSKFGNGILAHITNLPHLVDRLVMLLIIVFLWLPLVFYIVVLKIIFKRDNKKFYRLIANKSCGGKIIYPNVQEPIPGCSLYALNKHLKENSECRCKKCGRVYWRHLKIEKCPAIPIDAELKVFIDRVGGYTYCEKLIGEGLFTAFEDAKGEKYLVKTGLSPEE